MFSSKRSRNSDSRHPSRPWVVSGFLALALAVVLGQQAYAHAQQASDVAAIEQVVLTAAGASLQAVVAPIPVQITPQPLRHLRRRNLILV